MAVAAPRRRSDRQSTRVRGDAIAANFKNSAATIASSLEQRRPFMAKREMTSDDPMAAHGGGVWERYYCHFREGYFTLVHLGRSFSF